MITNDPSKNEMRDKFPADNLLYNNRSMAELEGRSPPNSTDARG